MQTFLQKAVDEIIAETPQLDENTWIVIPNRRGSVFIKKFLSEKLSQPSFAPSILSIEEFMHRLSQKHIIESDILIFELYHIFKTNELPFSQSFDEFLPIATSILHDFNEIDLHLADPKAVYLELNQVKAMELWTPNGEELTELQKRYLDFYNILFDVYKKFNTLLEDNGWAYQGKAYRYAAENIEDIETRIKAKHIYFCGFNALSKSEEKIFRYFKQIRRASVFWQGDRYYVENPIHEAGKFLREQKIESLNKAKWIEEDYLTTEKNIQVVGVSQNIGQVKAVGNILQNELSSADIEKTAIVLADENLLPALLNSLPACIDKVNITMGLPVKSTPSFSFFESLFKLHSNAYKLTGNTSSKVYYHKDVINILSHPIFSELISSNKLEVIQELVKSNNVFISLNNITSLVKDEKDIPMVELVFSHWDNQPKKALENIQLIVTAYRKRIQGLIAKEESNNFLLKLQLEYLFIFYKLFNRMEMLLSKYDSVKEVKTLYKLFQQVISGQTLPFFGEPLKGLQIMGVLETRTLDFENVIMVSVNEDVLPSGKSFNSIVPLQVKLANEIHTYLEKDSIFAYHFYRLLQKAKNIHLLYDCDPTSERNEKSRFIKQIETELPQYNPKAKITQSFFSFNPEIHTQEEIVIPMEESIKNRLNKIAERGFSPSAINQYITCSLKFYYRYIVRIDEADEVLEDVDAPTLGTIIHQVLEDIYQPLVGKVLDIKDLAIKDEAISAKLKKAFDEHFNNGSYEQGKNLLTYKVAENLIRRFLQQEIAYIKKGKEIRIRHLEKEFKRSLTIPEREAPINIKGFIDRLDEEGKHIRIIDYKTGFVDPKKLAVKQIDEVFDTKDMDKAVQLLTYQYLYHGKEADLLDISSGLISFRNLDKYYMPLKVNKDNNPTPIATFEEQLKNLFSQLFSPDNEFRQTEDVDKCGYCPYKNLCNR